jgi:MFS family permease
MHAASGSLSRFAEASFLMTQPIADSPSLPTELDRPTRVRFGVLGFACALSMVTYLDRVCFSSAASSIKDTLGLDSVADLKWAFFAFAFAYAAFEIPSGWLGDVFGPRNVLIRIVLWWSAFTALTGTVGYSIGSLAIGLGALVTIRFLFGMGEAGAYPNITRALHNWFPFPERGFAQGTVWMAGRLMGGLSPLVWLVLVNWLGLSWRAAFWIFGGLGIGWCILFAVWFRNRPEQKPEVNAAELALIRSGPADHEAAHKNVPWGRLLASANLWLLCLMYFCASFGWYFNITYLPDFVDQRMGEKDTLLGAIYKGGPLWVGAIACIFGGYLTDRFIRLTGDRKWGRRRFGLMGHSICALFLFACVFLYDSVFLFFLAISLAGFFNDLTMGPAWATCQDIGKRHAAIVAGFMNTVGNLGGALAGWLTGVIIQNTLADHAASLGKAVEKLTLAEKIAGQLPGFQINFALFGAAYVIAALLWLRIDSTRPVVPENAKAEEVESCEDAPPPA